MKLNKYKKDNNIIHEVEFNNIEEINTLISKDTLNSIFENNESFKKDFNYYYSELREYNNDINIRIQKEYNTHGKKLSLDRIITGNVNCYKNKENKKNINICYDLINKFNSDENINLNRFVLTYTLINKLIKKGYNVNFIPVLFLKAYDSNSNNEYVFIKINNIDIKNIFKYNLIQNDKISRVVLPEIIKHLDIENKDALDYNGYLLERYEKENIIGLSNSNIIIDFFTSEGLFNSDIIHDSEVFYKKLSFRNT